MRISKIKLILVPAIFILVIISGCDLVQTPFLENPNDPYSAYFRGKAAADLNMEDVSDSVIIINWHNTSVFASKIIINRSTDDAPFIPIAEVNGNGTTYRDSTVNKEHNYTYTVTSVWSTGTSSTSEPVKISFKSYPDNCLITIGYVKNFCISYDENFIVTQLINNDIIVNPIQKEFSPFKLTDNVDVIAPLKTSCSILLINNRSKLFFIRDIISGNLQKSFAHPGTEILWASVSPDDRTIACIDNKNYLRIYDVNSGIETASIYQLTTYINQAIVEFSNDGKLLALFSAYFRNISIKETRNWSNIYEINPILGNNFYFTSDSRYIVYRVYEGYNVNMHMWDLESGLGVIPDFTSGKEISFAAGEKLAAVFKHYELDIWRLENYRLAAHLKKITTTHTINDVKLTSLGKIIVREGDNILSIWDNIGYWTAEGNPGE